MEGKRRTYLALRACWRKKGHWPNLKAARKRARVIYKLTGIQMYPYYCGYCGEVHLTKQVSAKGRVI